MSYLSESMSYPSESCAAVIYNQVNKRSQPNEIDMLEKSILLFAILILDSDYNSYNAEFLHFDCSLPTSPA